MNSISVPKIITYIKTITAITNIVGQNIFFWVPKSDADITTDIYLVINIISQVPSYSQRQARLEFRFCSKTDWVTLQSLIDLQWLATANLCFESYNWVKDFTWFTVVSFIEWWQFLPFRDDLDRNILIKDYLVTFYKDEYE